MDLPVKPEVDLDVEPRPQNGDIHLPGEERRSVSPFVERVWRNHSDVGGKRLFDGADFTQFMKVLGVRSFSSGMTYLRFQPEKKA